MNDIIRKHILQGRLIGKYLAKGRPESAQKEIDQWLTENPKNQSLFDELINEVQLSSRMKEMDKYDPATAWQLLIQKSILKQKERIIRRWKIAAAILLIISLGGATSQFFFSRSSSPMYAEMNTIVKTERGQTSKVILPDSTIVYLNASTELIYSNNFMLENREVTVEGEAYFKVHKDKLNPFVVDCDKVQVKVLGTEFYVRTDGEDNTVGVILDEGQVELMHSQAKFTNAVLKPGERAIFNENNNQLSVDEVNSYKYTSWRDGILIFEDDPMQEVFKKLESWYDVDIEIESQEIYAMKFNATIMDESLEDLFELMKYTCGIQYQIIYSREPQISSRVIVTMK